MKKIILASLSTTMSILLSCSGIAVAANTSTSSLHVSTTVNGKTTTVDIVCSLEQGANFTISSDPSCSQQVNGQNTSSSSTGNDPQSVPLTTGQQVSSGRYAALGDSVAAGLGLSSSASVPLPCGRTTSSYPYQVAQSAKLQLLHAACSGATAGDLFTEQGVSGPNIPPQLDAAFASGTPSLITITAGANDAHWQDFLRYCYAFNCSSAVYTAAANAYLVALQIKLNYLFYDINSRSNGQPPTTIITGYYNPLSEACTSQQQNISSDEITWLQAEFTALNQTIKNVASNYSFVRFAPVNFNGHDICSTSPWVQGLSDPAPFHPTAQGQRVIGQAVIKVLNAH